MGDIAGQGQKQGNGMFAGGDGVAARGIHDDHTVAGSGGDIDVIHPDTGPADHLEIRGARQHGFGYPGAGTQGQTVKIPNNLGQPVRIVGRLVVVHYHFDLPGGFQNLPRHGRHTVTNHHFEHGRSVSHSRGLRQKAGHRPVLKNGCIPHSPRL